LLVLLCLLAKPSQELLLAKPSQESLLAKLSQKLKLCRLHLMHQGHRPPAAQVAQAVQASMRHTMA
jgi:hypothetical protein